MLVRCPLRFCSLLPVPCCLLLSTAWAAPPPEPPAQEIVEIRGQKLPVWPAADLRERGFDFPDLPREENAAWVYLEAANAYLDLPQELTSAFDYAVASAWPPDVSAMAEWLDRDESRRAIELAVRASRMDRCQMPGFGDPEGSIISVLLPSLGPCRMLAKMLVADGRRLEAERQLEAALEQYTAAMRMGHHLSQGFTLIESLVGIACWSLGDRSARELVLRNRIPQEPLAEILQRLEELRPLTPTVQRGFENERRIGPAAVDELVAHPLVFLRNGLHDFSGMPQKVRPQNGWDRLEARLGRLFLPDRTIKRHMLDYYDAIIDSARLSAYDARARSQIEEEHIAAIPKWDVVSRGLLPSLSRARTISTRCQVETQFTALAAGLQLHAARHEGKHPAALTDLDSELSPDVWTDPFSGRSFVYERSSEGWTVYSVGPDGEDNGGRIGERWDSTDSDMVMAFPPKPVEPFVPEQEETEEQP